jgi:hypothetical protein
MLPLSFSLEVLRKYKEAGAKLFRTRNAGRVMLMGSFRLDFGIDDQSRTITVLLGELLRLVPSGERAHWAAHIVSPPVNEQYLKMRTSRSCVDDGDVVPIQLD